MRAIGLLVMAAACSCAGSQTMGLPPDSQHPANVADVLPAERESSSNDATPSHPARAIEDDDHVPGTMHGDGLEPEPEAEGGSDGDKRGPTFLIANDGASAATDIDREMIRRVVQQHRSRLKFCYERELAQNAKLAGKVAVRFAIGADGLVHRAEAVRSSLESPALVECVLATFRSMTFPSFNRAVVVNYPLVFRPSD